MPYITTCSRCCKLYEESSEELANSSYRLCSWCWDIERFDTKSTEFPKYPYCGIDDQDWWDGLGNKNDGDSWVVECGFYYKDYRVTMNVSTSFTIDRQQVIQAD